MAVSQREWARIGAPQPAAINLVRYNILEFLDNPAGSTERFAGADIRLQRGIYHLTLFSLLNQIGEIAQPGSGLGRYSRRLSSQVASPPARDDINHPNMHRQLVESISPEDARQLFQAILNSNSSIRGVDVELWPRSRNVKINLECPSQPQRPGERMVIEGGSSDLLRILLEGAGVDISADSDYAVLIEQGNLVQCAPFEVHQVTARRLEVEFPIDSIGGNKNVWQLNQPDTDQTGQRVLVAA